jgi:hypothetical protein
LEVIRMTTEAKNDLNLIREKKTKENLERNAKVSHQIPKNVVELH